MNLPSGRDLSKVGRELQKHFIEQGTPIMIGGGLLAYTLLGIDYNESTGEIAFMILDPHFTGSEDVKVRDGFIIMIVTQYATAKCPNILTYHDIIWTCIHMYMYICMWHSHINSYHMHAY